MTDRQVMPSLTTFVSSTDGWSTPRLIPRPDIPVQAILSWHTFFQHGAETAPAVTDNGQVIYVTAARIAIAHGLELAGVRPGDKVLVPAYHCAAMVEPVLYLKAQPVFYALHEDLSVDLDDIARKIDGKTRVVMAANYFGFPQHLRALREFCDARGLIFIEDCAHSLFGSHAGQPLGTFGHLAVASLPKFFPVRDGGCLIIGDTMSKVPQLPLRSQGFGSNAVALIDTVEDAIALGRLRGLMPLVKLRNAAKRIVRSVAPGAKTRHGENPALMRSGQMGGFDPAWRGVRMTAVSRLICCGASRTRIVENRRRNYKRLAQEFSDLPRCRPLFPELPSGVVPYMFPLWIDHLTEIFATLEDRAVPMQRFGQFPWAAMDKRTCIVAEQLSRHLIQLPCHQDLTDEEISEVIDRVRTVAA